MTTLQDLIVERLSRRHVLGGLAATASVALLGSQAGCTPKPAPALTFKDIPQTIQDKDAVAEGYRAQNVIAWGDPVLRGAPAFDVNAPTAKSQAQQFGYNNDFTAFLPLPRGSASSDHGLLVVNHEFTSPEMMFAGYSPATHSPEQTAIELAAHGLSVVELKREGDSWRVVADSAYGRRITGATPIDIAGPAAGSPALVTSTDPTGRVVLGTLNNCGGGTTPWGTILTCEENIDQYFGGADATALPDAVSYASMDITGAGDRVRPWHSTMPRFNLGKEPHEPNRFGWVVEFDPYDINSRPVKRTALGRFKHEGATTAIAPDGRLVVYMGDDAPFEFLYRFLSRDAVDLRNPAANKDLLDEGTLSVARIDKDGLTWVPLVHGAPPLDAANGFASQAELLTKVRMAARRVGATPMDRPEDIETNPLTGRVYAILTNNKIRPASMTDPANPRANNLHGHILELVPPNGDEDKPDHAADRFSWNVFLLAGDAESGARYGEGTGVWLSAPDNCAFDPQGRLWIASDQGGQQSENGIPDGIFACETDGAGRAVLKFFYAVPRGAECCGPSFTPDGRTLFVAVQHPGEPSRFENPLTRWPDFKAGMPPRPAVVAITKRNGGPIGS